MEAMVNGTPVRALCGKVWVPSRDPKRFRFVRSASEILRVRPRDRLNLLPALLTHPHKIISEPERWVSVTGDVGGSG